MTGILSNNAEEEAQMAQYIMRLAGLSHLTLDNGLVSLTHRAPHNPHVKLDVSDCHTPSRRPLEPPS